MYDFAETTSAFPKFGIVPIIFSLAIGIFMIITMWKIYLKAGQPGWGVIIPIYNIILMLEIAGRPIWWVFLFLIPFVNIFFGVVITLDIAKVFGKESVFEAGMLLLPFIFYPILAFGKAEYKIVEKEQAV